MSRYEKKMKDKLDDEIKLAGLESVVPEELGERSDPQLESLANFRGCARLEIVAYVEAKFGLRIRDPSRATRALVDTRIPWPLM